MQQANKFGRPIITFIDTKGAYPGNTAEERGQSEAIARNLRRWRCSACRSFASLSGKAEAAVRLALGVGNRVLMLENAIYSVFRLTAQPPFCGRMLRKADQAAEAMKITANDLARVRHHRRNYCGAAGRRHRDLAVQAEAIKEAVWRHLQELTAMTPEQLIEDRYQKFRKIGQFNASAANRQRDYEYRTV